VQRRAFLVGERYLDVKPDALEVVIEADNGRRAGRSRDVGIEAVPPFDVVLAGNS